LDKAEIPVTKKGFEILRFFLENKNCMLDRKEILSHVLWADENGTLNRSIDVNITRISKKSWFIRKEYRYPIRLRLLL